MTSLDKYDERIDRAMAQPEPLRSGHLLAIAREILDIPWNPWARAQALDLASKATMAVDDDVDLDEALQACIEAGELVPK